MYQDHDGNVVHHFNIPGRLSRLSVIADALVESLPVAPLPETLGPGSWDRLDAATASGAFWELLNPSPLHALDRAAEGTVGGDAAQPRRGSGRHAASRERGDLLARSSTAPRARASIRRSTRRWRRGKGVCQDFTHIMIALVRQLGIPCRYVSGYLYQQGEQNLRSVRGRDPRLARSLAARAAVGRLRSDQRSRRRSPPHPRRRRPRLCRRAADARRLQGRERGAERALGVGASRARGRKPVRVAAAADAVDLARRHPAGGEAGFDFVAQQQQQQQ